MQTRKSCFLGLPTVGDERVFFFCDVGALLWRVIDFVLGRCRHGVDGGCHLPRLGLGLPAEREGRWRGGSACHECEAWLHVEAEAGCVAISPCWS